MGEVNTEKDSNTYTLERISEAQFKNEEMFKEKNNLKA